MLTLMIAVKPLVRLFLHPLLPFILQLTYTASYYYKYTIVTNQSQLTSYVIGSSLIHTLLLRIPI